MVRKFIAYDEIKNNIEFCIKDLLKKGMIINPKFSDKHCKPFRIHSNSSTGILKNMPYVRIFLEEYSNNNYLFLLNDRSMIQCNYEFSTVGTEKKVKKMNLVFLPNPNGEIEELSEVTEDLDTDIEEINQLYSDIIENEFLNDFAYSANYIRLDYTDDEDDYSEFIHARCHLHIGLNNNFRIPVNRVPLLSEFFDFIYYLNYPNLWEKMILEDCEESEITEEMVKKRKENVIISTMDDVLTEGEKKHYHIAF